MIENKLCTLITSLLFLLGLVSIDAQIVNKGQMVISDGSVVTSAADFTSTAGTVLSSGTFIANKSFNVAAQYTTVNTDTLTIEGNTNTTQTIATPLSVNTLIVNSDMGLNAVDLSGGKLSVFNHVEFNNGVLFNGDFFLSDTTSISGGNDSSYLQGFCTIGITTPTNTPVTALFPIGDAGHYAPLETVFKNDNSFTTIFRYMRENPMTSVGPITDPTVTSVDSSGYWEAGTPPKTDYTIAFPIKDGLENNAVIDNLSSDTWVVYGYTDFYNGYGVWEELPTTFDAAASKVTASVKNYTSTPDFYVKFVLARKRSIEYLKFDISADTVFGSTNIHDADVTISMKNGQPSPRDMSFKIDWMIGSAPGVIYSDGNDYSLRGTVPASVYGSDTITLFKDTRVSNTLFLNSILDGVVEGNERLLLVATPLNVLIDSFSLGDDRDSTIIIDGDDNDSIVGAADLGIRIEPIKDLGYGNAIYEGDTARLIVGLTKANSVYGRDIDLNVSGFGYAANGNAGVENADYKLIDKHGNDITAITSGNKNMTIPEGSSADTVYVVALKDNLFEGTEMMEWVAKIIPVGNPHQDQLSPARDTLALLDLQENTTISLKLSSSSVTEGSSTRLIASLSSGVVAQDTIYIQVIAPAEGSSFEINYPAGYVDFGIWDQRVGGNPTDVIKIHPNYSSDSVFFRALKDSLTEHTELVNIRSTQIDANKPPIISGSLLGVNILDAPLSRTLDFKTSHRIIKEGDVGYAWVELQQGAKMGQDMSIGLQTIDNGLVNNATFGEDYTLATPGSFAGLTIKAGQTHSDTITLTTLYDNLYEPLESIIVDTIPGAYSDSSIAISPMRDTVWIQNMDTTGGIPKTTTNFTFNVISDSVYEGTATPATISLPKGMVTTIPLTFNLTHPVAPSTAIANDYTLANSIIIPAGKEIGSTQLYAKVNQIANDDKWLYVTASTAGAQPSQIIIHPKDTVRIKDVDGVRLVLDTTDVKEGVGQIKIYANIPAGGYLADIRIDLSASAPALSLFSATANDYNLSKSYLTLLKGNLESDTVILTATPDALYEPTEDLEIKGTLTIGGGIAKPKLIDSVQLVQIFDRDQFNNSDSTFFTLKVANKNVNEGQNTTVAFTMPSTRTAQYPVAIDLNENQGVSGIGHAIRGADFDFEGKVYPGKIIIPAGAYQSNNLLITTYFDSIYQDVNYLKLTGAVNNSTQDAFAKIVNSPDSIFIHNVDTVANANTIDSIDVYVSADKDTLVGKDTVFVTLKLPGNTTLDINKSLSFTLNKIAGTATTKYEARNNADPTDYDVEVQGGGVGVLKGGKNSVVLSVVSKRDNWLEVLEWIKYSITPELGAKVRMHMQQDTIFVVDGDVALGLNTLTLNTIPKIINEGGRSRVFVSLDNNRMAGQPMSIRLTHPNTGTATFTSPNGTGIYPDDYTLGTILTIDSGATHSDTLYLTALTDNVKEADETVDVQAFWDAYPVAKFANQSTVTIKDTTTLQVQLSLSPSSVIEGNDVIVNATFLNGATSSVPYTVTVSQIAGGNAISSDYSWIAGNVITIPAGASSGTIALHIIDDGIYEGDETMLLQGTHGATNRKTNSVTLSISDKQANVNGGADIQLLLPTTSVNEGDSVRLIAKLVNATATKNSIAIPLTHPGSLAPATLANYPDDYRLSKSQLTIQAGKGADTVWIIATKDGIIEGDEWTQFTGSLGFGSKNTLSPNSQTLTIIDKETKERPAIGYSLELITSKDTVLEGTSITVTATLPDSLTTKNPIVFTFDNPLGGTATPTNDYTVPATITIPAGGKSGKVTLTANTDGLYEGYETILLNGSTPNYNMIKTPKTIYIKDLDANAKGGALLELKPLDGLTFTEGQKGRVVLHFQNKNIISQNPVTVNLLHPQAGSTALNTIDYTLPSSITIPAGKNADTVWFNAQMDNLLELQETAIVKTTVVSPADSLAAGSTPLTFVIDEFYNASNLLNLTMSMSKDTLTENNDQMFISASLPAAMQTDYPITVTIDQPLPTSTATNLEDYKFDSNTITIAKGAQSGTVRVVSIPDNAYEGLENVIFSASTTDPVLQIINPVDTFYIKDAQANEKGGVNLTFDIDSAAIHEFNTAGYAAGTVSLDGASESQHDISFTVKYLGDKADSNDYKLYAAHADGTVYQVTPNVTPVTLYAGAGVKNVRFRIYTVDDNIIEGDEWLRLGISPVSSLDSVIAGRDVDTLLIIDDDARNPQGGANLVFSMAQKSVMEGSSTFVNINFAKGKTADRNVDVRLDSLGVLPKFATGGGIDYDLLGLVNNVATIPAGTNGISVPLSAITDYLYEGNERLSIDATPVNAIDTFTGTHKDTVTIVDAEAMLGNVQLNVTQQAPSVGEGDSMWVAVSIKPIVVNGVPQTVTTQDSLSVVLNRAVSSVASSNDYTLDSVFWILPGSSGDTLWMKALKDNIAESDEKLDLQANPGLGTKAIISPDKISVTITDSTLNRTIIFRTSEDTVNEGQSMYLYAEIQNNVVADQHGIGLVLKTPSGGTAQPSYVDYNIDPNASGTNYTLTFKPYQSHSDSLKINAMYDDWYDPYETIVVNKDSLTNKTFAVDSLPRTIWIQDMDTTKGTPGTDTLHVAFSNNSGNDSMFQGEDVVIRATLPGNVRAQADMKIAITTPYDLTNPSVMGSGYATKGRDVTISDTLVIKKGTSFGEIKMHAKVVGHGANANDSIRIFKYNATFIDPKVSLDNLSDSIFIIDASVVLINIDTTDVKEGDSVKVWLTSNAPAGFPKTKVTVTLSYDSLQSTARYNDYTMSSTVLVMDSAQTVSVDTVYIKANPDNIYEVIEQLTFNGSIAYEGSGGQPVLGGYPFTINIYDVDTAAKSDTTYFTLHTDTTEVFEGDSMYFWVSLPKGRIAGDTTLTYLTHPIANSTAEITDYSLGNVLTIKPGNNSSDSLKLKANLDNIFEFPETVVVDGAITNEYAVVLNNNPSTVVIRNMDTTSIIPNKDSIHVTISTSVANKTLVEGTSGTLTVRLSGTTVAAHDLYFTLNKIGGNATTEAESANYDVYLENYPNNQIVIKAGENSGSVQVNAVLDNLVEGVEQIIYNVIPDSSQLIVVGVPDTLNIVDQDVSLGIPMVSLQSSANDVNEGDSIYVWAEMLNGNVAGKLLQISLNHPGVGTAIQGLDYHLDSVLTFQAGSNVTDTLVLVAYKDNIIEPDEDVVISASSTNFPDSLIDQSPTTVMIHDRTDLASIQLSVSSDSVREGDSVYIVADLGPLTSTRDVVITLSKIGGTAAPEDYDMNTQIIIPAGHQRDSVRFLARVDNLYEGFEHAVIKGTVTAYDSSELELTNSPIDITIVDANANALGGARIILSIPKDSVVEGDTIPVFVKMDGINALSAPVRGTIEHPYAFSVADSSDYLMRKSFSIPRTRDADTLYFVALKDQKIEEDEILNMFATPLGVRDSITNPLDSLMILDVERRNAPYNVALSLSSDTISEGGDILVSASLPDTITTQIPVQVIMEHPQSGSTADGNDYGLIPIDTINILSGNQSGSIILHANIDHKYEGTERLILGANIAINSTLFQMIDTPQVLTILDREDSDSISANNFTWKLALASSLDSDQARIAANVNGTDADGTAIPQNQFGVDGTLLNAVQNTTVESVHDMVFYTPSGKPDTVQVMVTDADSTQFNTANGEVINAYNFTMKYVDRTTLINTTACTLAQASAYALGNKQGVTPINANSALLNNIVTAPVAGLYPLSFSTSLGTTVTINVLLSAADTSIIDPVLGEAIEANPFYWRIKNLNQLNNAQAIAVAQAKAYDLSTGASISVSSVDSMLQLIKVQTVDAILPLTFTTVKGAQITVDVTVNDKDTTIIYPSGNSISGDYVVWNVADASQFNTTYLAIDTAHVSAFKNEVPVSSSNLLVNPNQVLAIQNANTPQVLPLTFYIDRLYGDSVVVKVILVNNDNDTTNIPQGELLAANDFAWSLADLSLLNDATAQVAAQVTNFDLDGDSIISNSHLLPSDFSAFGSIVQATVKDLVFTTDRGTSLGVKVVVTNNDTTTILRNTGESIGANNFKIKKSALPNFHPKGPNGAKDRAQTTALNLTTGDLIPRSVLLVDSAQFAIIKNSGMGNYPLTYSTAKGADVTITVTVTENDTTTIDNAAQESIGADELVWRFSRRQELVDEMLLKNSANVNATDNVFNPNKPFNRSDILVNAALLSQITNAAKEGVYPMRFTTPTGKTSVGTYVVLLDRDTTVIDVETREAVAANDFAWKLSNSKALVPVKSVVESNAIAYREQGGSVKQVLVVPDSDELRNIRDAVLGAGVYPLNFMTSNSTGAPVVVVLTNNDTTTINVEKKESIGATSFVWNFDDKASMTNAIALNQAQVTAFDFTTLPASSILAPNIWTIQSGIDSIIHAPTQGMYPLTFTTADSTTVVIYVCLSKKDTTTINPDNNEFIGANNFGWKFTDRTRLNNINSVVAAKADAYDYNGNSLQPIHVDQDLFDINNSTEIGVYPLTFISSTFNSKVTVHVALTNNDNSEIDQFTKEAITSNDFTWKLADASKLQEADSRIAADVHAFDFSTGSDSIDINTIHAASSNLLAIQTATSGEGIYPLPFSTANNTSVLSYVLLTDYKSGLTPNEYIIAEDFAIDTASLASFTPNAAEDSARVRGGSFYGLPVVPFAPYSYFVDPDQMDSILQVSHGLGVYPLTYYTPSTKTTVTINVVVGAGAIIINPDVKEYMDATPFKISTSDVGTIDNTKAKDLAQVYGGTYDSLSTTLFLRSDIKVDSAELSNLNNVDAEGVYALTFTSPTDQTSITTHVLVIDRDTTVIDLRTMESISANYFAWKLKDVSQLDTADSRITSNVSAYVMSVATDFATNTGIIETDSIGVDGTQLSDIQNTTVVGSFPLVFSTPKGTEVGIPVLVLDNDSIIVDPNTKEAIGANGFVWDIDSLMNLNNITAVDSSHVEVIHFDGAIDDSNTIDVDLGQLSVIQHATQVGTYPLTFTSANGVSIQVYVAVVNNENRFVTTDEYLGADNFVWKQKDLGYFTKIVAADTAQLTAFDLITGNALTDVVVDDAQFNTLVGATGSSDIGVYDLTFANAGGAVVSRVVVTDNDTTTLNRNPKETVGANHFSWSIYDIDVLDSDAVKTEGHVRAFNVVTGDSIPLNNIHVDSVELSVIQSQTVASSIPFPLTFTWDSTSVTIQVMLLGMQADSLSNTVTIVSKPGDGCAYEDRCDEDQPYTEPQYYGLDTMKYHASIRVRTINSLPADSFVGTISYIFSGGINASYFDLDNSITLHRTPSSTRENVGYFNIVRKPIAPDSVGFITAVIHVSGLTDTVRILVSNDFDNDGFINAVERNTCIKYTDGIYNEWYFHAPMDDADKDGISNIVESGNVWEHLYTKDADQDCTPDFLDIDSNGDGIPDEAEKFTNNGDSADTKIHVTQALSPNGDGLGNEKMYIANMPANVDVSVSIFDRVGKLLYVESKYNNKDRAFAGIPNQGGAAKLVPQGTYYYYIKFTRNGSHTEEVYSGFIEIRY